ncbi:uncharacterized protein LOC118977753 isoform X2 [Sturnira hondurensis]|uniref:uncharacterized protein LOC118977753 isoform X2 n=1 Tax=Sturnira hondurensis TaxID=192404 RepID=UPI00187A2D62|nr:uncharacterized protein LOC118977753 isoform X2 [Sturnira hondurensis]
MAAPAAAVAAAKTPSGKTFRSGQAARGLRAPPLPARAPHRRPKGRGEGRGRTRPGLRPRQLNPAPLRGTAASAPRGCPDKGRPSGAFSAILSFAPATMLQPAIDPFCRAFCGTYLPAPAAKHAWRPPFAPVFPGSADQCLAQRRALDLVLRGGQGKGAWPKGLRLGTELHLPDGLGTTRQGPQL